MPKGSDARGALALMEICEANLGSRAKPGIPPSQVRYFSLGKALKSRFWA
jgi:hypothetical protein